MRRAVVVSSDCDREPTSECEVQTEYEELYTDIGKRGLGPPAGWAYPKDTSDPRFLEALMMRGRTLNAEAQIAKNI